MQLASQCLFGIYYTMCVWVGNIKMVREGMSCECVNCTDVVQEGVVSALVFVLMNLQIYKSRKCPDQASKAKKAVLHNVAPYITTGVV